MAEWENMLTLAKLTYQTLSSGNNTMQPNDITFFQRFQEDILAGRKTITIRDESESHFKAGDILRVGRYEDEGVLLHR